MAIPPSVLAMIGMGASGIASTAGSIHANRRNVELARENRQWQEYMSGSSYQRAVKDLEAAGLNPLLAVGAQASTPSGSVAGVDSPTEKGVGSALEAMRIRRETMAADAQIKNVKQQTESLKNKMHIDNQDLALRQLKQAAEIDKMRIQGHASMGTPSYLISSFGTELGKAISAVTSSAGQIIGNMYKAQMKRNVGTRK